MQDKHSAIGPIELTLQLLHHCFELVAKLTETDIYIAPSTTEGWRCISQHSYITMQWREK